jgi:hypothetical protein
MTEIHALLFLIFIANVLQIPQVQKLISWLWVNSRYHGKYTFRFIIRWGRRAFYSMKGLFNG